jgi:hypothetical protein
MSDFLGNSIVIAFSLFLVQFIADEATYQRAKRTTSGVRFPPGIGMRLTLRAGGPLILFATYKVAVEAATTFDWIIVAIGVLLGVGCVLGEPGEIRTTPEGVLQRRWLGLSSLLIPWEGAAASYSPGLREVLVVGSPRILLPSINGLLLLLVTVVFLRNHGGWQGDLGASWSNDTVSESEMTGAVLCSRWRLVFDGEPLVVRGDSGLAC